MRAELERLRLECDVFLPAEAQRLASEAQARGARGARRRTAGRASAEALRLVAQAWQGAGRDGRDLYVLAAPARRSSRPPSRASPARRSASFRWSTAATGASFTGRGGELPGGGRRGARRRPGAPSAWT